MVRISRQSIGQEMMADICGWDKKTKLVYLTTRLKGQALSFQSCTLAQKADYNLLVKEMLVCIPVRGVDQLLPREEAEAEDAGVHTSTWCRPATSTRGSRSRERLLIAMLRTCALFFYRAYPVAQQGSQETENLSRIWARPSLLSSLLLVCYPNSKQRLLELREALRSS